MTRFLDTNVLLRHVVDDLPEQSRHATDLLLSIESGEEMVYTTQLVLFETIFTLSRYYKLSLEDIRERITPIVEMPGIKVEGKGAFDRAFHLAMDRNIDFQDAFNVVYMQNHGLNEIYTWDRHFDRVEGIERIEPGPRDERGERYRTTEES